MSAVEKLLIITWNFLYTKKSMLKQKTICGMKFPSIPGEIFSKQNLINVCSLN
jgi:hypothetical protein